MRHRFLLPFVFLAVLVVPTILLIQTMNRRPTAHEHQRSDQITANGVPHTIIGLLTDGELGVVPPPTDLQIASAIAGQVILRWATTSSEQITGYRVYRDGSFLGIVDTTSFGDTETVVGGTYHYSVLALNSANQQSKSVSITVRAVAAVAIVTPPTPKPTTTTPTTTKPTNKNVNTAPANQNTNTTIINTNTTVNTNTPPSNTNTTPPHTPQTYDMHLTQQGVVGNSNVTITASDSIRFILDTPNQELVFRFTPSPGTTSVKLDHERTSRTITFSTAGVYTFSSNDDPAVHGTITVLSL